MDVILYCDESDSVGEFYSNFYGGTMVPSNHLNECISRIEDKKVELNLFSEVKWQKVTESYLEKYKSLMDEFFDLMTEGKIKVRLMFTQNVNVAVGLTKAQRDDTYFILYYQFIKHAFGLIHSDNQDTTMRVRIYFDELPHNKEKCTRFKNFVHDLSYREEFLDASVYFPVDQISEVDSKKHVILQCLDVILGAMAFRLNNKHRAIPEGSRRRGARTVAKEKLYKHINGKIRELLPKFNIGVSTGWRGGIENIWHHPYRHWLFVPSEHEYDGSKTKNHK